MLKPFYNSSHFSNMVKILLSPQAAHEIYMIVAANRTKPKSTELEVEIDDNGRVLKLKEVDIAIN